MQVILSHMYKIMTSNDIMTSDDIDYFELKYCFEV
jgi:hypothetical protein